MSRPMHARQQVAPVVDVVATPDDHPPSPERQAKLRAAYETNIAAGNPPYQNVQIQSRGDLAWIFSERGWSGEYDAYTVKYVLKPRGQSHERADLRRVNLSHVTLRDVFLRLADLSGANLVFADLAGAHLTDARLHEADLGRANLSSAELNYTDLSYAHLREANLHGANLRYANLNGTRLFSADLGHAVLYGTRMEPATILSNARFDAGTRVGDIIWNGVSLARIDWDLVPRLGDEAGIPRAASSQQRLEAHRAAARAYLQLAQALQSQGLSDEAGRYAYRGQVLQRKVLWRQRRPGRWLFSLLLALVAGYGYRLWRILAWYGGTLVFFSVLYWLLGVHSFSHEVGIQALWDGFLVSLSAIHGRAVFEQLGAWSPAAWVAGVESVIGIVIEGVFVAMLVQRFFGGR